MEASHRPSPEVRHRALASRPRVRLLELLHAAGGSADAYVLSADLDLHLNTVRAHLAVLERAGLVVSRPEDRRVPGRPRVVYHLTAAEGDAGDEGGYGFLAPVLVDAVATSAEEPGVVAREAGRRWGQQRLAGVEDGASPPGGDVRDRLRSLLDELGFAPMIDPDVPDVIELRECPVRALAAEHPDVVCAVHLGVLQGAMAVAGHPADDVALTPFVTPTTCQVRVA
jgi:predicted ArsR family transcriptional regulator